MRTLSTRARIYGVLTAAAFSLFALPLSAQTEPERSTLHENPAQGLSLGKSATEKKADFSYIPKFDGTVKAKFEMSTYDGAFRFDVRNTRFGLSGHVSPHMIYRIQVDFSNEGNLSVLDAFAGYQGENWSVTLGQQRNMFSNDLARGPSSTFFANRSLLAKFVMGYWGSSLINGKSQAQIYSLGSRDLGALGTYTFRMRAPLKLYFGIFNGSGINNPQWDKHPNLMGRAELGGAKGLRFALAYYHGQTPERPFVNADLEQLSFARKIRIVGAEMRYIRGNLHLEGEYSRRYLRAEQMDGTELFSSALVQGYYRFPMPRAKALAYIAPTARWDLANGINYLNTQSLNHDPIDANRVTVGVNLGFSEKFIQAELRLNYEKYFLGQKPSDFAANRLFQDKITLELVAAF